MTLNFPYDPLNDDPWNALGDATQWCSDNDYSVAPMCGPEPIGIMKGDVEIAKWRNLTSEERKGCDGIIVPDGGGKFRNNSCTIKFRQ